METRPARGRFSRSFLVFWVMNAGRLPVLVLLIAAIVLASATVARAQPREDDEKKPDLGSFPARIDEIRITGLARTHQDVVRREIGFREGDVILEDDFDLALTRLWNTTIFAHVRGRVVREGARTVAVFELEDRWSLRPVFSFGSGGGALYFDVGATDNNIAGRFLEATAYYENFNGFDGGYLVLKNPRLFWTRRVELTVQAEQLIRPRPGFADRRALTAIEMAELIDRDRVRVGLRASAFADRFLPPLDSPPHYPLPTESFLLEPRFRLGRIDTIRVRQRGATIDLRPGLGFTSSDVASEYVSMIGEVIAFAMPGKRWNLALRARAASVSKVPEHLQLYAGGLDLVRGFPDNYVRTRAYAMANFEARYVAFDSTWVALIPAVFVDVIGARNPQGDGGGALSAGAGVRFVVPKFVASGLRVDLAMPLASSMRSVEESERRFGAVTPPVTLGSIHPSVGVYQFF